MFEKAQFLKGISQRGGIELTVKVWLRQLC